MLLAAALLALALVGFANALYFTLVTYRVMRPDPAWLPSFCSMDEGTCARVVDTRYARALGPPNSVFGLAWYALAGAAALAWLATGTLPFARALAALAGASVAFSVYLAWALLARLKVVCRLCFLGHATNVAILVVLALALTGAP